MFSDDLIKATAAIDRSSPLPLSEEVDALMVPLPPDRFGEPDSPIVRLFDDYKRAERDYYLRPHLYPPHHIIGMRRKVFDRNPWRVRILYDALERI